MTTSIDLDDLHKRLTAAHIEHRYNPGDLVITVIRGTHVWTVSEGDILYWGESNNVCETPCRYIARTADAYGYITDAYAEAL